MAVIQTLISPIVESADEFAIIDGTDYVTEGVAVSSKFMFHDYGTGLPTANTSYDFSSIIVDGNELLTGGSFIIETDGASNIINPEIQYRALVDILDVANPLFKARLVMPANTSYRFWYIEIYTFDVAVSGATVSVAAPTTTPGGGTITPLLDTPVNGLIPTARNLTLIGPDGEVVDLGAVAQVDNIALTQASYAIGETWTVSFCGDDVTFVNDETKPNCVAEGIANAINSVTDVNSKFYKYVSAEVSGNSVVLTSKESGVPIQISVAYTGGALFTLSTTVNNISSMGIPDGINPDFIEYKPTAKGGKYTAILTVVDACDYNTNERIFYSWVYDIASFECCFLKTVQDCGCGKSESRNSSCFIRSIIRAIDKMKTRGFDDSDIQKVVNMGWSICGPCGCGCK
jgi:hypothetical protein